MAHVVSRANAPFLSASGALMVHQIPAATDNLTWLAVCTQTGAAAAIDGPEAQPVLDYCAQEDIRLTAIFNTHTHPEHIGINLDLARAHELRRLRVVGAEDRAADIPGITERVKEGSRIQLGDATGVVWLTEGHIDGHVSYIIDGVLFCGDTLFGGGCGRLFDGPPEKMHRSLSRMAALPADTLVCCAHEYTQDNLRFAWMIDRDNAALKQRIRGVWAIRKMGGCTVPSLIREERETNPFMRVSTPSIQWAVGQAFPEIDVRDPAQVLGSLRAWKNRGDHRAMPEDVLPL